MVNQLYEKIVQLELGKKMEWINVKNELPIDELRVLLCDINKNIYIGTRDEYGYTDDNCEQLYDIIFWAYLPKPPHFYDCIITNDKFVDNLIKNKQI